MDRIRRWVGRHVAYPLMLTAKSVRRRAGWRPMRQLRRFQELARAEPREWREFRDRQLRIALENALRHIPLYRPLASRLLARVRDDPMGALRQFPILSKRERQEREDELLADYVPPGGRHSSHTGGSTGHPTRFWHDHRRDAIRLLGAYRDKMYTGWRPGDPVALIEGTRAMFWMQSLLRRALNRLGGTYIGLHVHRINAELVRHFLERLERHRPVVIRGITSAVDECARFIEADGLEGRTRGLKLRGVITSCEKLYPHQRERIERVFGTRVFDLYGSNEMGVIATECSVHQGLHVSADSLAVEIVDDDGHPVPRGESGRIVVTDPWNLGFSLIRYDLDDVGRYLPDDGPCPCGVTFPRLAPVEGTTMHFFTMPDGTRFHGSYFAHVIYDHAGVRQFRIVQEVLDEVVIQLVGDREAIEPWLPEVLELAPPGMRVRIEFHDELPLTAAGKRIYYISRLPDRQDT